MLDKTKMADNIDSIMEEVAVLKMLDHPNIVNHMETYDDTNLVYIGKFLSCSHSALVFSNGIRRWCPTF